MVHFMMIRHLLLLTGLFLGSVCLAQAEKDKPAYLLYNSEGEVITYSELLNRATDADMIFFGELHNDAIAHWLQLELVRDLAADESKRTHVGLEMFEADQQILIDEYFDGLISQSSFESEARLWNNYATDYKPILEFAKDAGLSVVATNIPRRYASAVFRGGLEILDSLSDEAKQWIAPLPVEVDVTLPSYANISEAAGGHGGDNLIYAQAIKDATMAHFILLNMKLNDRMFHVNGSYHSNQREGIVWYIEQAVKGYRFLTINTILSEDPENVDPDDLQAADITLVVPSRMTRTY